SAGGLVGWIMNTSRPRTFSSILTKISPSANRRIVIWQSGWPRCPATSSARGRLAVPLMRSIWLRACDRSDIAEPRKIVVRNEVSHRGAGRDRRDDRAGGTRGWLAFSRGQRAIHIRLHTPSTAGTADGP